MCAVPGRFIPLASIILLRHQFPLPAQDRPERRDRGQRNQRLAARVLAQHGQPAPFGIREPQFSVGELPPESAISVLK
jgi:hypothetical protein